MLPDIIQALQKRLKGLLSSTGDQASAAVSSVDFLDGQIKRLN